MIERVRNFWNNSPCDSTFSDKEPATREYFSEVARYRYNRIPEILEFVDFDRWKGRKVLEIGCGIGTDTLHFCIAGADITAIDLSESSLETAKKHLEVWGNKAHFYPVNIEDLRNSTFYHCNQHDYDLVYSFGVLHHTPNPVLAFHEILSLCRPYTELRVMLYAKYSLHNLWLLLYKGKGQFWRYNEILMHNAETQYGCPLVYYYTFSDIRKLMIDYQIKSIQKGYLSWARKYIPKLLQEPLARAFGGYIFIVAKVK